MPAHKSHSVHVEALRELSARLTRLNLAYSLFLSVDLAVLPAFPAIQVTQTLTSQQSLKAIAR